MKIECTVEELKGLMQNVGLKEKTIEIKIDSEKVDKLNPPSMAIKELSDMTYKEIFEKSVKDM